MDTSVLVSLLKSRHILLQSSKCELCFDFVIALNIETQFSFRVSIRSNFYFSIDTEGVLRTQSDV